MEIIERCGGSYRTLSMDSFDHSDTGYLHQEMAGSAKARPTFRVGLYCTITWYGKPSSNQGAFSTKIEHVLCEISVTGIQASGTKLANIHYCSIQGLGRRTSEGRYDMASQEALKAH